MDFFSQSNKQSTEWKDLKQTGSSKEREKTVELCKITRFDYNERWKCHCLGVIHNSLQSLKDLEPLVRFVEKIKQDYRKQVILNGAPVLVVFCYEEKIIYIASQRLHFELFAIKNLEKLTVDEREKIVSREDYEAFKLFAKSCAALDPNTFPSVIEEVTAEYELADPWSNEMMGVEKKSDVFSTLRHQLLGRIREYRASVFERVSDFSLGLTAQYALIRIHLLKFLAILPSLDHDQKGVVVKEMLLESLRRLLDDNRKATELKKKGDERALPTQYRLLFSVLYSLCKLFPASLLSRAVRSSVRVMAKRFIAGETIEQTSHAFKTLYQTKRDVTVDQLGELVVSEKEADHYMNEVIKLIEGFHLHVTKGEKNQAGINRAHVSIKVSALCSDFRPEAFEYTYSMVEPRLKKILMSAKENHVFLNVDAEHYDYRDLVFKIYSKVLLETEELKDFQSTGIVVQAYLRDGAKHLREVCELAQKRGHLMPIRLVKGAYWDAETIDADAHAYQAPEFLNKEETDLHFRQLIIETLKMKDHLQLCLASHNFSDHAFAQTLKREFFLDAPAIEHQCLHMTYEALSVALSKMGWPVRNYVPIGSLLVGMAYLVRRIMENSSQVGVLTIMRSHKKKSAISSPEDVHIEKREAGLRVLDPTCINLSDEFINLTPARLYLDSEREWVEKAYQRFQEDDLGKDYSPTACSGQKVSVTSSSNPELLVGSTTFASREDVKKSFQTLQKAYQEGPWPKTSWVERSMIFINAGLIMSLKRAELSALISYEAGKSIPEALADVDEAVDFLNYYAREEGRIHKHNPTILSRGVCAVIAPWNFPLAIPCGMTTASLVAGNTVVLKSAEQTPLIAQKMCEILWQAGVPRDVLIHLPGNGEEVGQELVNHPQIAQITFTGSKAVGVMIHREVSKRVVENKLFNVSFPAKVITEMGGKNAIIVTANAELDETVAGALYSAFSHAGQKCSAASRLIVDESIADAFIERFKQACLDIKVGVAFDFSTAINPVISQMDKDRLLEQIKEAAQEAQKFGGKVIVDRSQEELPGFCVGPAFFEVPAHRAFDPDSYAQKELFGPVVHLIRAKDLDHALSIFNSTSYALTGGVFSQSQDDIDYLTASMECGNIYVNRSITGARVGIEPFGGFKLSGTGPKAGGRNYLPSFHVNKFDEFVPGGSDAPSDGTGSSYDFDYAQPSRLSIQMRAKRMVLALDEMIQHFEALYQGLYSDNKEILMNFRKWIMRDFINFVQRKHWNRRIPGQLSYNNLSLTCEKVALVAYEKRPYFACLSQVLGAILMGCGVTIMARNEDSYRWWNQFKNLLGRSGFSKQNFDVYFVTEELLQRKLAVSDLSFLIIDGKKEHVERTLAFTYDDHDPSRVRITLSAYDCPHQEDFKRICEQFVWTRSFAVNTIRHGAPLALQLEGAIRE